jgi:hypothetical protein
MMPKRMQIVDSNNSTIELKGFGSDDMGAPFDNYGMTLHIIADEIDHISLHIYDRGIRIDFIND